LFAGFALSGSTNTCVISLSLFTFDAKSPLSCALIFPRLSSEVSISPGMPAFRISLSLLASVGDLPLVEMAIFKLPF